MAAAAAAPGKGAWEPPKFVQHALGQLPITQDGEHPQKRFYR